MARFMDSASSFDVEIVDDWLFLYAQNRPVVTLDPAVWAQMFGTVGAVITKLQQWARWRDDRLRAAGATQGAGGASHILPAGPPTAAPALFTGGPAAPTPGALGQPWAPPPGVAPGGRRLKRAFPWASVLAVSAFAVAWVVLRVVFGR